MVRWSTEYQELYFPQNRIEAIVDISDALVVLRAALLCQMLPEALLFLPS